MKSLDYNFPGYTISVDLKNVKILDNYTNICQELSIHDVYFFLYYSGNNQMFFREFRVDILKFIAFVVVPDFYTRNNISLYNIPFCVNTKSNIIKLSDTYFNLNIFNK